MAIRLTGLWEHKNDDGTTTLVGGLGGGRIRIIGNQWKTRDNEPDFIMYLHEKEDQKKDPKEEVDG